MEPQIQAQARQLVRNKINFHNLYIKNPLLLNAGATELQSYPDLEISEKDTDRLVGQGSLFNTRSSSLPIYEQTWWQILHFFGFFIGGTTFIAGTSCYYYPDWQESAYYAAVLYIIGSIGFAIVDAIEFVAFTEYFLKLNICISLIGSTLYIIGSIGFLPSVVNAYSSGMGIWGFILGSLFIGCSEVWKLKRIGTNDSNQFSFKNFFQSIDYLTQAGVESGACFGGCFFFIGTIMYNNGNTEGSGFMTVLAIWITGSLSFTVGSLFLFYRHGIMRV